MRGSRLRVAGFAAIFAAGVLVAVAVAAGGQVADTTTASTSTSTVTTTSTEQTDTTTSATTTSPATTSSATTSPSAVIITTTTTTRLVPVPATTTASESSGSDTATWVWVLIGLLAVGLIALIVLLARRGRDTISVDDRRRQLDSVVGSWSSQGWAIQEETTDSAVLRRGAETMVVSVDKAGHVSTRPLPGAEPLLTPPTPT